MTNIKHRQYNGLPKTKIGVVTWCGGTNYGTNLQAYAIIKALSNLGYEPYFIHGFNHLKFGFKDLICGVLFKTNTYFFVKKILKRDPQYNKIAKFQKEEIPTLYITSVNQYNRLLESVPVFLSASDQIWNPDWTSGFMMLDFAEECKRISYATSIGVSKLPAEKEAFYKRHLSKYNHISLREQAGVEIIKNLLPEAEPCKVLDPTFLLTSSDWRQFSSKAEIEIKLPKRFLLVYLIGKNEFYKDYLKTVSDAMPELEIVTINSAESGLAEVDNGISYSKGGPREFVKLIHLAEYVVTDSFHACALCVNMSKEFTVLKRFKDTAQTSQNSRIYDLLKSFGLESRLMDSNKFNKPGNEIMNAKEILDREREENLGFLRMMVEE